MATWEDMADVLTEGPPSSESLGARGVVPKQIGRYLVLGELGWGGMGRVLRAYDPTLEREVALKELRRSESNVTGRNTKRLIAEARAMAKLSHPNVVEVYDVEVLAGVVVVMEYVRGTSLHTWLRGESRTWAEIVEAFVAAGRGLAAAHDAGILHRDFKPANVLVQRGSPDPGDRRWNVKVTDFGLATFQQTVDSDTGTLSFDATASPGLTQPGLTVGTPRYMAPEQHQGQPLSPAADQYAFCVSLWEALCMMPPFDGKDMARQKRKGPPPFPALDVPRSISRAVVRGLDPDPSNRWPSMEALLEQLSGDAVGRRRRRTAIMVALGVVGSGLAVAGWLDAEANRCSGATEALSDAWGPTPRANVQAALQGVNVPFAQTVSERTVQDLDQYAEQWTRMYAEACEATAAGKQPERVLDLRMGCLQRAKIDLKATGELLEGADRDVVQEAHELVRSLRPVSGCADVAALQHGTEPSTPREEAVVQDIRKALAEAKAARTVGRFERGLSRVELARTLAQAIDYPPIDVEITLEEGANLLLLDRHDESERAYRWVVSEAPRWSQWAELYEASVTLMGLIGGTRGRPEVGLRYRELAAGLSEGRSLRRIDYENNLGLVLLKLGRTDEALPHHRRTVELARAELDRNPASLATAHGNLGATLAGIGRLAEAEQEYREALDLYERAYGGLHPSTGGTASGLSRVYEKRGQLAEAEEYMRQALSVETAVLGSEHPTVGLTRLRLATVVHRRGNYEEAIEGYRDSLPLVEATWGPNSKQALAGLNSLAAALMKLGRWEEAEEVLNRVLSLPADSPAVRTYQRSCRVMLGGLLYTRRRYAAAAKTFKQLLEEQQRDPGVAPLDLATLRNNYGMVLLLGGHPQEAEVQLREVLEVRRENLEPGHPSVVRASSALAECLVDLDRTEEALLLAEDAWRSADRDDMPPEVYAHAAFVLAMALKQRSSSRSDRSRARSMARVALDAYARSEGEEAARKRRNVEAWLRALDGRAG